MNYPYISIFPNGIDKRTYFCDVSLTTKSYMDAYMQLLEQGKFIEANILLSQSPLHSYGSGILNFIEAKIKTTQDYVLQIEKYNPYHLSDEEPDIEVGEFWI